MPPLNPYPTPHEEAALRDVLGYPTASLADRSARLKVTRAGAHYLLKRAALKGLAQVLPDGSWVVTRAGSKWLGRAPIRRSA